MKESKINVNNQISIPIGTPKREVLESELFDSVSSKEFSRYFRRSYAAHKKFFLQLTASRTSMSTALANVQALVEDELGNSVELMDKEGFLEDRIDTIYDTALTVYSIIRATRFVPDEFRKDIIMYMLEQNKPKSKATSQNAVGMMNGQLIRKDINDLEKIMEKQNKNNPDSPYGKIKMRSRQRTSMPTSTDLEPESPAGVKRKFRGGA